MSEARRTTPGEIDRAAQAVFDWHLAHKEKGYSAQVVRVALADEHPCIRPKGESDCKDAQIAIWRRVLRKAEQIAFDNHWYMTPVPGGNPDDRILTQEPTNINRGVEKLIEHAWTRMSTARGHLSRVATYIESLTPADRAQFRRAEELLTGAMAALETGSTKLQQKRALVEALEQQAS